MQYNDIKPCNRYIKQDHSYCCSPKEHQTRSRLKRSRSGRGGTAGGWRGRARGAPAARQRGSPPPPSRSPPGTEPLRRTPPRAQLPPERAGRVPQARSSQGGLRAGRGGSAGSGSLGKGRAARRYPSPALSLAEAGAEGGLRSTQLRFHKAS